MNIKLPLLKREKKKIKFKKNFFLKTISTIAIILLSIYIFFKIIVMVSQVTVLEFLLTIIPKENLSGVNILAFGIDQTKSVQRADTLMLIHLNPNDKKINILSIPRDTRLKVNGQGLTKVNHAYAHGKEPLLKESISNLLGLPIHFYIKINLNNVKTIIDEIGGVEVDVEKNLYYEDKAGGLYIDIKKGQQLLNGKQAVQYLRFRQDKESDIGRIKRQQKLLTSINQTLNQKGKLFQLPVFIRKLSNLIETDLSIREMLSLSNTIIEIFREGKIQKETLPGKITLIDGVSFWKPNITQMDTLIKDKIIQSTDKINRFESEILTEDKIASQEKRRKITLEEISRIAEQTNLKEGRNKDFEEIRIEILNGLGKAGEALKAAKLLKSKQLSITKIDNAGSFNYKKTMIVDWKSNIDKVIALAQHLKIDPNNIIVYDKKNKNLEVTIVLGKDWPDIIKRLTHDNE